MSRRAEVSRALAAMAVVSLAAPALGADKSAEVVVPLAIAVADDGGKPAADAAWIDAEIAAAEKLYAPLGIHFKKASTRALDERRAHLETKKDRDALFSEVTRGELNVFVVGSLRDVDDASRMRMGVHWRPASAPKKHYVILSKSAMPSTLAHELGHYFGLAHASVTNNVMSYSRAPGATVFLDAAQDATILRFLRISIAAKDFTPSREP